MPFYLAQWDLPLRPTIFSSTRRSSSYFNKTNLEDTQCRTPITTLLLSWRSVVQSRWMGSLMTPSSWGYFLSLWRIRPSFRFWTRMLIRSLRGMVSPRHSYASIFLPRRPPDSGMISPPSLKWRVSLFMRHGSCSKSSNGSAPIMESRIGCWCKRSPIVFNNRWRSQLMQPPEALLWPNPWMKPSNYLKIWHPTSIIGQVNGPP